ncbi:MAG: ferrous iron transport protein B [Gemmataceae bacterium]|nr:ferrous iron transport protein B [Gemmataceae bacterium]
MKSTHPTIALVGNPNTGKTTLFNALSGLNQRVGNYPGVTVETKKGKFHWQGQTFNVIDLPGAYSLAARSPDEMVAVDVILGREEGEAKPDVVVAIVDASNLERNLYLTTQLFELGVPVVVALNMMDVAAAQGITIDVARLSERLNVPVIPVQANKSKGIQELKAAVAKAVGASPPKLAPSFPPAFEEEVASLGRKLAGDVPSFLLRRLLIDVGGQTERLFKTETHNHLDEYLDSARARLAQAGCGVPAIEARVRYGWIRQATADCLHRPVQRPPSWTDRIDAVLTHRVWGLLVFLAIMFIVFQSIFAWAKPLMEAIGAGQEWLGAWVGAGLEPGPLRSLLVDGVVKGVGSVLVFLPQILILFAFVAVLEDCGYMARAAYLMDRLMARAGLNGKSFIPLLSSMACAVPGIMAARVIENRRDRFATIVVAPLMSCSARLPVYALLIGAFLASPEEASITNWGWWRPGVVLFAMYCLGLVLAPLVAFALKRTLLRGETPVFVMEMPLYKRPSVRIVARRAIEAGWQFVYRAGTLILASMIVIWALLYFPATHPSGDNYDRLLAERQADRDRWEEQADDLAKELEDRPDSDKQRQLQAMRTTIEAMDDEIRELQQAWKAQSYLGRVGRWLEPMVRPLGWDWRIGLAALASFPAREVMVGTLGLIFQQGEGDASEEGYQLQLGRRLQEATWDDEPTRKLFNVPVALSIMVFFALCCQCASTLAVIKRETHSWRWPAFTFVYMTTLAYLGALLVYQVGSLWSGV